MEGGIEGGKREVEEEGQKNEREGGRWAEEPDLLPPLPSTCLAFLSVWNERGVKVGERTPLLLGSAASECKGGLPWSTDICFKGKTERVTWTSQAIPMLSGVDDAMLTLRCHCFCTDRKRGLWGPVLLPVIPRPPLRLAMTQPAETERETRLFSLLIQGDRVLKALFNFHETAVD